MSTPEDVRHEAAVLYERFVGTERQRNAGGVVAAYALNGAMDACMEDEGFPDWDWSILRPYATPVDALTSTVWFAEPHARFKSEDVMPQLPSMRVEAALSAEGRMPPDREAAASRCFSATPRTSDDAAGTAAVPPLAQDLIDQWFVLMTKAGQELGGDVRAFTSCMDHADISVLVDNKSPYADLGVAMSSLVPADLDQIPASDADPAVASPHWQRLLRAEQEVINADWACRRDVYERSIMDLAPVIRDFAEENAAAILDAEKAWDDKVEEAAHLGYDGSQIGPLGK